MKVGDTVYTKINHSYDDEYIEEGRKKRRAHDEWIGVISEFHDSHGASFGVTFKDMETAFFSPDELTVLTQPEWLWNVQDRGIPMYRSEDWFTIAGRGRVALVDVGDNPLPRPGDPVRIDGAPYTVVGTESKGGKGPKVGLLVKDRDLLHGKTPKQWIKEGVPCDGCRTADLSMDDPGYHEEMAEVYKDEKFLCAKCARDYLEFNLNEEIRIKITPEGEALYNADRGNNGLPWEDLARDDEGYVRMQAWRVMSLWGPHTHWGGTNPFEMVIRIPKNRLR